MSSKEENVVSFPGKDNGKKAPKEKKPKYGKSIGWFIGIFVVALICVAFVLPTTVFSSGNNDITFGSYNGKDISLSYDSYYYFQLQNIANYYAQQYGGMVPSELWYQIYYTAFQNAAVYEAIMEYADAAGITPSDEAVSDTILASGYWNNAEGNFDTERYNAATSAEKQSITKYSKMMVPYQAVVSDMQSIQTSDAELKFISGLSADTRDFEYYVIDANNYGDSEALAYANNNPKAFTRAELSIISFETEEEAISMIGHVNDGITTFETEAGFSVDGYGASQGKMGEVPFYNLQDILHLASEDAADQVFAAEVGTIVGPFATDAGYSIFRVDAAPYMPDFTDPEVLRGIKNRIATTDPEILLAYIGSLAQDVYKAASEDFDAAADKYNLTMYSVKSVAENPGNSEMILSFNYADYNGHLVNALASNAELSEKLFNAEENVVIEPILSGTSYIVARPVAGTPVNEYLASAVESMYSSYAGQISLADMQNAAMNSGKLVDNFFATYLSDVMATPAN